jgi:hypothetical protein
MRWQPERKHKKEREGGTSAMPKGREIRHAEVSSSGGDPNAGTFDALRDLQQAKQQEEKRQKNQEKQRRYREQGKQDLQEAQRYDQEAADTYAAYYQQWEGSSSSHASGEGVRGVLAGGQWRSANETVQMAQEMQNQPDLPAAHRASFQEYARDLQRSPESDDPQDHLYNELPPPRYTAEQLQEARSLGGQATKERGLGIFAQTPEQLQEARSLGGQKGGQATKERGLGIFAQTPEQLQEARSLGGQKGGQARGAAQRGQRFEKESGDIVNLNPPD